MRGDGGKYGSAPAVGNGTGDGSNTPSFIGVPKGYVRPIAQTSLAGHAYDLGPGAAPMGLLPKYQTGSESVLANLSTENLARLQIRMAKAGLIGPETKIKVGLADNTTVNAYRELLGVANRYGETDMEALDRLESNPDARGSAAAAGDMSTGQIAGLSESQKRTVTRVDKSVTKFTALDAESAADRAFQDALGEDSTPHQQKALRAALNAYAAVHPQVSTTQSHYNSNGDLVGTNTTSSGGIDAAGVAQVALDQAKAAPDYAEVQAATTYFNALQQALGATASVGR